MSPEESAAHNLRVFRRIRPGTIFSVTYENDYHREIMVCSKVIDSSTLEAGKLSINAFEAPLQKEKLLFAEIALVNILKENAVSISASASWNLINIYDEGRLAHATMSSVESDDCFDEIKHAFEVLTSNIQTMNVNNKQGRLFTATLSASIADVKSFLALRGWQELSTDSWRNND